MIRKNKKKHNDIVLVDSSNLEILKIDKKKGKLDDQHIVGSGAPAASCCRASSGRPGRRGLRRLGPRRLGIRKCSDENKLKSVRK
jgi:hypothetical protein